MNPLCVTATTDKLSAIGRRNIENLKRLGVDYIEVTTNPVVRRRINRLALTPGRRHLVARARDDLHDAGPHRRAVRDPLIVWGENPQNEYGGPAAAATDNIARPALARGVRRAARPARVRPGRPGRASSRSTSSSTRTRPTRSSQRVGVTGHLPRLLHAVGRLRQRALRPGARVRDLPAAVEGSLVNYENLDNVQTGIHDYFKFLKYGFGRATDLACLHIRRGRLRRDEAIGSSGATTASSRGLPGQRRSRSPRRDRHDARRVRRGLRPLHEQEALRLRRQRRARQGPSTAT